MLEVDIMKMSNLFFYTLREVKDDDSISNQLLTKAGMLKRDSAGVYAFMPLGYKVLKNIEQIIRKEMNSCGANELIMPALLLEETYEKTGRIEAFGNSILKLKDRTGKRYVLGPTHEEVFTNVVKDSIKSYKQLPVNLYQFQTKYRDEARPRFGLIRTKEFVMKDAYSFDKDYEGLDKSYQLMYDAYCRSFDRMGIKYVVVKADTGAMGGQLSEEFMAVADIGEDKLVLCNNCNYAANLEVAECVMKVTENSESLNELKELHTPNVGKISDLVNTFGFDEKITTKSLIYKVDDNFVLAMVRGDRAINEVKLQKLLKAKQIELAEEEDVKRLTSANVGFAGPIGINIKVVVDNEIYGMKNFLVGANKTDYHFVNVNIERDFKATINGDIRNVTEDDVCPLCGGHLKIENGIEVGNTFKLGTKYSEELQCLYLDEDNTQKPMIMGSYGIGLARCLATIVEQNNDENGIVWPLSVAPYKVIVIPVNISDATQMQVGLEIYNELSKAGIETILDDRDERGGVKFKDADLIGIPIRIVVGKKAGEGIVEFKYRNNNDKGEFTITETIKKIMNDIFKL
jgi:prolyl-tRNA synthetase